VKLQIANVSALNAEAKAYKLKDSLYCQKFFAVHKQTTKETVLSKDIVAKEIAKFSKVKQLRK
jgi:hypothetical protein